MILAFIMLTTKEAEEISKWLLMMCTRHSEKHKSRKGRSTYTCKRKGVEGSIFISWIWMIRRISDLRPGTLTAFDSELGDKTLPQAMRLHLLLLESRGALSLMYGTVEWPSRRHTHSALHMAMCPCPPLLSCETLYSLWHTNKPEDFQSHYTENPIRHCVIFPSVFRLNIKCVQ